MDQEGPARESSPGHQVQTLGIELGAAFSCRQFCQKPGVLLVLGLVTGSQLPEAQWQAEVLSGLREGKWWSLEELKGDLQR